MGFYLASGCRFLGMALILNSFWFTAEFFHPSLAMAALTQEQLDRFNRYRPPSTIKIERQYLPNEYSECILSDMKGVSSDLVADAITRECERKYPAIEKPEPPKSSGFFGSNKTPDKCLIENSKKTASKRAVIHIRYACYRLYRDN